MQSWIVHKLDSIPPGSWRLFQVSYNIIVFLIIVFGIWWGSDQRKELKAKQEIIISKQDSAAIENMKTVDTFFNKQIENK